jgi:nucleotide-binding universal stress UspA family protein
MTIRRVLLGLGGTEYTPVAIRRAIELAQHHEAEITGVTIVDESRLCEVGPVPVGGAQAARALREHRMEVSRQSVQDALKLFQESCERQQVAFRTHQETGESFSLMTDLARYHDVMIFGLRSIFDYGLDLDPQDTLARLVRAGVRPLIAVSREYRPIRRTLLAYSGSPESAKTIKRFVQSQLWPDVKLRLLTCARSTGDAAALLAEMSAYCRAHGYEAEIEASRASPKTRILAAARDWDADLVVLGNGARNLWLNRVLGSTALHVIQNADRPLYLAQ